MFFIKSASKTQVRKIVMQTYNVNRALELAQLSRLAYENFDLDPLSFSLTLKGLGYELNDLANDTTTDTQVFVASRNNDIFVVFRGTYQFPKDIFTDIAAQLVDGGHEGVFRAFSSIRTKLEKILENHTKGRRVYTSGHSLGGGLAKAAVLEMRNIPWEACYTFGAPAICNEEKASGLKVPVFSIINIGDIVPRIMEFPHLKEVTLLLAGEAKKLVERKIITLPEGTDYFDYVNRIGESLENYKHFPELIFYNRNGHRVTMGHSLDLFKAAINTNWKSALEDHSIISYCNHIQKYIDNSKGLHNPIDQ
jgi:triacylglycerol lipase